MPDSITRCPKCRTSFRVSSDHLSTARGAVRCGSCLTIFNAKEHLVRTIEKNAPSNTATLKKSTDQSDIGRGASRVDTNTNKKEALKSSLKEEKVRAEDDVLISDDMHLESHVDDEETTYSVHGSSTMDTNLFERSFKEEEDDSSRLDADESWALDLLKSSKEEAQTQHSDKIQWHKKPAEDDEDDHPYSTPAFQVIEEESDIYESESNRKNNVSDVFDEGLASTASDPEPEFQEDSGTYQYESYSDDDYQAGARTTYLDAIEPEPLELGLKTDKRPIWQSPIVWSVLCLAAAALAFFQMAYLKYDTWSRDTLLRPYYAKACEFISCSLPAMQDLSKIRVENLAIITHPNAKNILLVDAILLNRAKFEQPFPSLEITFNNKAGDNVGTFQFLPNDYVGGELAGKKLMPINHPIHINVTIPDPGKEAINYNVRAIQSEN